MEFKRDLKCLIEAIVLIVPGSLIFNAPAWAIAMGLAIAYLISHVSQKLDDLKEKTVD